MNLPTVITNLVTAQNNFDSLAYSNCFSQNAVVFDEGHTHTGRKEIEHWIADSNERYKATMKPVSFDETESLLKAEVSGNFPGSPLVLSYQLDIQNGEIQSLKIV